MPLFLVCEDMSRSAGWVFALGIAHLSQNFGGCVPETSQCEAQEGGGWVVHFWDRVQNPLSCVCDQL